MLTVTPGGGTSQSNVFEWSSADGGATLTGPGLIGDNQMAGGAVALIGLGASANAPPSQDTKAQQDQNDKNGQKPKELTPQEKAKQQEADKKAAQAKRAKQIAARTR